MRAPLVRSALITCSASPPSVDLRSWMVLPPRTHGTPALRVRGSIGCRTKLSVRAPPSSEPPTAGPASPSAASDARTDSYGRWRHQIGPDHLHCFLRPSVDLRSWMVLPPRTHGTPALRVRGCIGCRTKLSVPAPAAPLPRRQALGSERCAHGTRMAGGGGQIGRSGRRGRRRRAIAPATRSPTTIASTRAGTGSNVPPAADPSGPGVAD